VGKGALRAVPTIHSPDVHAMVGTHVGSRIRREPMALPTLQDGVGFTYFPSAS